MPPPHIEATYKMLKNHKWYMEPRLVTVNDLYAFDPNAKVSIDPFVDIIGRHFKQPKEGLGNDNSPVRAHVAHAGQPGSAAVKKGHGTKNETKIRVFVFSCCAVFAHHRVTGRRAIGGRQTRHLQRPGNLRRRPLSAPRTRA